MSTITTAAFWKDAGERALSTVAQSAVASIGVTAALSGINWETVGDVAGLAGILSILKSIIASNIGDGTASLVSSSPSTAAEHAASTPVVDPADAPDTSLPTS